jgi:hypothetical protein
LEAALRVAGLAAFRAALLAALASLDSAFNAAAFLRRVVSILEWVCFTTAVSPVVDVMKDQRQHRR